MKPRVVLLLLTLTLLYSTTVAKTEASGMNVLSISSPTFKHGEPIPVRYSCDGADVSPPLVIGKTPPNTQMLVLIMDDPDAPVVTWVHWIAWNIPAQTREIPENSLPPGARQGRNDWKRNSYGGPCPPSGTHRYYFKLYALDITLQLASSTTKTELERAMQGHILAKGELMGTYRRR